MMNTNSAKAPKASSKSNPIAASIPWNDRLRQGTAAAILGALAACSSTPLQTPAKPPVTQITDATHPGSQPAGPSSERPRQTLQRERSRWVAVDWSELPGWGEDRAAELWPALLQGCARPAAGWAELCARAALAAPTNDHDVTLWLMQQLQAFRVESPEGEAQGLLTGYFEPMLDATRRPQGSFQVAVHAPPADLQTRRPYFSRQQLESEQSQRLRGLELAYLDDPLDLLVLQIQGSGRLRIKSSAQDEGGNWVRLSFAGHNDHPYQSIGKLLVDRGELRPGEASWPGIRDWLRRNPQRAREMLWNNPRYVFFREEPLRDPNAGPRGAQGVPLTPGRSVAVDRGSIPYGTALWLEAGDPLQSGQVPLRRLVMAQDTGSAITGAVRADFFWGWGREAEAQAGRMKDPLRLWALWPRDGR